MNFFKSCDVTQAGENFVRYHHSRQERFSESVSILPERVTLAIWQFLTIRVRFPNLSPDDGDLAEWLGSGLQIRLQQFESASRLSFLRGLLFLEGPLFSEKRYTAF